MTQSEKAARVLRALDKLEEHYSKGAIAEQIRELMRLAPIEALAAFHDIFEQEPAEAA